MIKENLDRDDIINLLKIKNTSEEFYELISKSNAYARKTFKKGYIFAQIGINSNECSGNCKFCSMAKDNFLAKSRYELSLSDIEEKVSGLSDKVSDLFLMTTADYCKDKFLEVIKRVKQIIPKDIKLVANIGDFDLEYAKKLKEAGASGCYHIKRLREGIDTDIPKSVRENTINAIKKANLDLYYCIEPIGKEHSYEEIADEILYAKRLGIDVMAVMKKVSVDKTQEEISLLELTKICSVTMLAVQPKKSMNTHEPNLVSMLAGVNQLYAEFGMNPRDEIKDTEKNRGQSVENIAKSLAENGWIV